MNETTLALFKTKLEKIRITMIGDAKDKYKTKKDDPNEQTADIAEDAALSYNRQLEMGLGEQGWRKLRSVEDAIKKIDDGQYGICPECQESIPEARLIVIPFAEYCVDCLQAIEKNS